MRGLGQELSGQVKEGGLVSQSLVEGGTQSSLLLDSWILEAAVRFGKMIRTTKDHSEMRKGKI